MPTATPDRDGSDDSDDADNWKKGLTPKEPKEIPKAVIPYINPVVPKPEEPLEETDLAVPTPVKQLSAKDTFYMRQEKSLMTNLLTQQPVRPVRSICQITALERRYEEGAFKPGMVTPGCVSLVRLTNWIQNVDFDIMSYDNEGMLRVTIPMARFYLTTAMWQETDKLVEHYVYDQSFLWPIHGVKIFPGFTIDENEENVLLDNKHLKPGANVDAAWDYFEDTCIKRTPHPPFWSPIPKIWMDQLEIDTEWMRKYVFNHIWNKVHRSDAFVKELFLCPKDPVFMGSDVAFIDPTSVED